VASHFGLELDTALLELGPTALRFLAKTVMLEAFQHNSPLMSTAWLVAEVPHRVAQGFELRAKDGRATETIRPCASLPK
jgi:hypothetical protein